MLIVKVKLKKKGINERWTGSPRPGRRVLTSKALFQVLRVHTFYQARML